MSSLDDGHHQVFKTAQQVFRIACGSITPVPFTSSGALRRNDIHSSELRANHRSAGRMLSAGVQGLRASGRNGTHEHVAV